MRPLRSWALVGRERPQEHRDGLKIRFGELTGAVLDNFGHRAADEIAIGQATVLEQSDDILPAPTADALLLVRCDVGNALTVWRILVACEFSVLVQPTEQVARCVAFTAVVQGANDVGAAVPFLGTLRVWFSARRMASPCADRRPKTRLSASRWCGILRIRQP